MPRFRRVRPAGRSCTESWLAPHADSVSRCVPTGTWPVVPKPPAQLMLRVDMNSKVPGSSDSRFGS
eukprot:10857894-Alexandrium_andersonii.AAC.1